MRGKVKEIVTSMDALREHSRSPRNITLRQYIGEKFKDTAGKSLEVGHLYSELGIDPLHTKLNELYQDEDTAYLVSEVIRDGLRRGIGMAQREQLAALKQALISQSTITSEAGNTRFISPEVFTDPIMRGAVQAVFYPDLVIREIGIPQPNVTMPLIDLSDAKLEESAEGATIEVGTVSYGSKDVKVTKEAKGLQFTYESLEFNTLDLVALYFEDLGRQLGSKLNNKAVLALINGDQVNLSENAAVIGVTDPTKGFQYRDILRGLVRLSRLGRAATSIIGNEETIVDYLDIEAVKNKQFSGNPLLEAMMKSPLPTKQSAYVSGKVAANQLVLADASSALVQLTARYLMLETEKIVRKQISGTFASIITGFANFQRNARVIIDKSVNINAANFPAWMAPYED